MPRSCRSSMCMNAASTPYAWVAGVYQEPQQCTGGAAAPGRPAGAGRVRRLVGSGEVGVRGLVGVGGGGRREVKLDNIAALAAEHEQLARTPEGGSRGRGSGGCPWLATGGAGCGSR